MLELKRTKSVGLCSKSCVPVNGIGVTDCAPVAECKGQQLREFVCVPFLPVN